MDGDDPWGSVHPVDALVALIYLAIIYFLLLPREGERWSDRA